MRVPSPARVTTASMARLGRGALGGRFGRSRRGGRWDGGIAGEDRRAAIDRAPLDGGHNHVAPRLEPTPKMHEVVEDLPDNLLELPGSAVTECREMFVDRVVVVLLRLDAGVGRVLDYG